MKTITRYQPDDSDSPAPRRFRFQNGCIYFSHATERKIYFALTLGMAVLGLLTRFGLLK